MAEPTIDVLALRILRNERDDVRASLSDVRTAFREPNAGSARADDADWLARRSEADRPGLKGILDVALEYVVELLRVADEYLVAIETILRSRETRPPQHRSSHPIGLATSGGLRLDATVDQRGFRAFRGPVLG